MSKRQHQNATDLEAKRQSSSLYEEEKEYPEAPEEQDLKEETSDKTMSSSSSQSKKDRKITDLNREEMEQIQTEIDVLKGRLKQVQTKKRDQKAATKSSAYMQQVRKEEKLLEE